MHYCRYLSLIKSFQHAFIGLLNRLILKKNSSMSETIENTAKTMADITKLESIASQVRRDIVRMVHAVNSGHPGEQVIVCDSQFTLTIDQLREVNEATLPALFGGEKCSAQVSESYWDQ